MADGAGKAIPILPAGRLDASMAFYEAIGFTVTSEHEEYAVAIRGRVELHLIDSPGHDPLTTNGMAYLRVPDVDDWYARVRAAGVSNRHLSPEELQDRWVRGEPIARMTGVEDKPWGLREFALLDADNNLVRIGQPLA